MKEWEQVVMVALGLTAACVLVSMGATELAGVVAGGALGYMSKSAPKAAATLLVLCLAGSVSGCTQAQFADALAVVKPATKWTCAIANALCVKGNDDVACGVIAGVCGVVEPLLSDTSGGEEEGVSASDQADAEVVP